MISLQWYPPYHPVEAAQFEGAQAIVVLSAGAYYEGPEYLISGTPHKNADRPGPMTLQRLEYTAFLARHTGLPLLVTGGSRRFGPERALGRLMAKSLEEDFHQPVRWIEDRSLDTLENARYSHALLAKADIERILLVTHAWHLPRAAQR